MAYVYVAFDKDWFEKHKREFSQEWNELVGDGKGFVIQGEGVVEDWELSEAEGVPELFVLVEYPVGTVKGLSASIRFPITADMMVEIIKVATKQLNKLKTVLEALK